MAVILLYLIMLLRLLVLSRKIEDRFGSMLTVGVMAMLLFHVFRSAYNFAENTYNNLVNWFGFHDDTLSALQRYTDDMRQKRQERGV